MDMSILEKPRSKVRGFMRRLAELIHRTFGNAITPGMITTVSGLAYIPICYLIIQGHFVQAGLMHLFFGSFDMLDGELARATKRASLYGMIYDASTDRLKIGLLMAGVAQYLALNGQAEWVFVPVMVFGLSATVSYVKAKGEVGLAKKYTDMSHHQINNYFKEGLIPYDLLNIFIAVGLFAGRPLEMSVILLILGTITLFWLMRKVSQKM